MRSTFVIAASILLLWDMRAAFAQNPLYSVPGLGGYMAAREANQIETLRAVQQYRILQEALLLQQQRSAIDQQQREEQRRLESQRQAEMEAIQTTARRSIADRS